MPWSAMANCGWPMVIPGRPRLLERHWYLAQQAILERQGIPTRLASVEEKAMAEVLVCP